MSNKNKKMVQMPNVEAEVDGVEVEAEVIDEAETQETKEGFFKRNIKWIKAISTVVIATGIGAVTGAAWQKSKDEKALQADLDSGVLEPIDLPELPDTPVDIEV